MPPKSKSKGKAKKAKVQPKKAVKKAKKQPEEPVEKPVKNKKKETKKSVKEEPKETKKPVKEKPKETKPVEKNGEESDGENAEEDEKVEEVEKKKRKKTRVLSFNSYINKVLHELNENLSLNEKAIEVLNGLLMDTYKKIVSTGQTLMDQNKKKTFQLDDAIAAGKLVFGPNEALLTFGLEKTKQLHGSTSEWDNWQAKNNR